MPGFLSKIFRRKEKASSPTAEAKQSKQRGRGRASKREKQPKQASSRNEAPAPLGPKDEEDGLLGRTPSFTATTTSGRESTGREQASNYSPSNSAPKKVVSSSNLLSPRNSTTTPSPRPRTAKKTTPVDLDVSDFDESDRDDDNAGLSFHQLQQFNMQNQMQTPQQLYSLADNDRPSPKQEDSEASSHSEFNLSTDAEDEEYNSMKRNVASFSASKKVPQMSDRLDISGASQNYTTDEERAIFPALHTDDEDPASAPDDEPGHIKITPMSNHHDTEEDMRAWGLSPSTGSSGKENGASPRFQKKASPPKEKKRSYTPTPSNHFANFANFDADFENAFPGEALPVAPTPTSQASSSRRGFEDAPLHNRRSSSRRNGSNADSSLPDLLAQAQKVGSSRRSNSNNRSSSSVNSAPAITSQYLRQYHGLSSRSETQTQNDTSVSDIIQSLEDTNAARLRTRSARSVGSRDSGANASVRSAKERIRERRRREREGTAPSSRRHRSAQGGSDESEDNDPSENWLFDEVTGALGPRGVTADMESLSGRSNRSKNSGGGRSHKSHRSHRSQRSKRRPKSSNESVDSRGSRNSRNSKNSRNSRYSHKSTRSYLSQMSEQSRSVANDLLRLEMQLAMVGSQENGEEQQRATTGGSVGGSVASRASRTSRNSSATRRSSAITKRSKISVVAPPGKLGIILANKADSKGTVVSGVRTSSVLAEKISPGDRIIAIDGEDVSRMTVSEITTIMARKSEFERTLTVLTTPKHMTRTTDAMGIDPEGTTYATFRR